MSSYEMLPLSLMQALNRTNSRPDANAVLDVNQSNPQEKQNHS
jgi:hypothetical protein